MISHEIDVLLGEIEDERSPYLAWKKCADERQQKANEISQDLEIAKHRMKEHLEAMEKKVEELGRLLNPTPVPTQIAPITTEESEQVGRQA